VAVYNSGLIGIFDVESRSATALHPGLEDYAYSIAISPGGSLLAVGYYQGVIQDYDLASGDVVQVFSGSGNSVSQLIFIGEEFLISVSYDLKLTVWNLEDGGSLGWLNLTGTGYSMQLSPDGRVLAVGGYDGIIRFFGIPCEEEPSSPAYPALQEGALPAAPVAEVSQSCIVVVAPPSGGTITYALEEGFHRIDFPADSTPDPKETILWSNFTRAEEGGGILSIWLEEGDTTVELNPDDGSVKVTIPDCYPAP